MEYRHSTESIIYTTRRRTDLQLTNTNKVYMDAREVKRKNRHTVVEAHKAVSEVKLRAMAELVS